MNIQFEKALATTTTTWLTPPEIIEDLGPFDTDPCCPPNMPWRTAATMYTEKENGLLQKWEGRVWLNPPYGKDMEKWLKKMAELKSIVRGGKISDAWISESDAAGLLGMQPRTLRRQATKETAGRLPFSYRNTNGRSYQYKRADITAYLRQTSVPA